MARYEIPSYRVLLAVIDQELAEVEKRDVSLNYNARIANVDALSDLDFDATFPGIGAQSGDLLGIPGDSLPDVADSPAFLCAVTSAKVGCGGDGRLAWGRG
ncbi:MAG: hypothetical protein WCI19_03875 [Betaproteobacteria bacterium]|nr:hypothetical protein [Rhodocyclales bacterium]